MKTIATIVIQSESGRRALLARAETQLGLGECLAMAVDVIGLRHSVRTTPTSKRAVLVALEVPSVLRGGITRLVSYYCVPTDELEAKETHRLGDDVSHEYDLLLRVMRLGVRAGPEPAMLA
ncbi:MAG: hypothetical protein WDA16_11250 [Candidatus Thermoplasmatota archaeon]